MGNWEQYVETFSESILGGDASAIVSSIFIIALCAFGLWKAYKIFKEI